MTRGKPVHKLLIDTNILAYLPVPENSPNIDHKLRSRLAGKLLTDNSVTLVVYEEQLYEVRRALDDLLITNKIKMNSKINSISSIYNDFARLVKSLASAGRAIIANRTEDIIQRASQLYAVIEQRMGKDKLRRMHRISVDLKIIAAAEKHRAAIVTRDKVMYIVYRDALYGKVEVKSFYYLNLVKEEAHYHVCGDTLGFLEDALDEACSVVGLRKGRSIVECL